MITFVWKPFVPGNLWRIVLPPGRECMFGTWPWLPTGRQSRLASSVFLLLASQSPQRRTSECHLGGHFDVFCRSSHLLLGMGRWGWDSLVDISGRGQGKPPGCELGGLISGEIESGFLGFVGQFDWLGYTFCEVQAPKPGAEEGHRRLVTGGECEEL